MDSGDLTSLGERVTISPAAANDESVAESVAMGSDYSIHNYGEISDEEGADDEYDILFDFKDTMREKLSCECYINTLRRVGLDLNEPLPVPPSLLQNGDSGGWEDEIPAITSFAAASDAKC